MALKALGNAGEASGPNFRAADPVVMKARNLARSGASPTTKLAKFLVSTKKTHGWDYLVELIYNGTGAVNEFDQYGHFIQQPRHPDQLPRIRIGPAQHLQRALQQGSRRLGLRPAGAPANGSWKNWPKRPAARRRPVPARAAT